MESDACEVAMIVPPRCEAARSGIAVQKSEMSASSAIAVDVWTRRASPEGVVHGDQAPWEYAGACMRRWRSAAYPDEGGTVIDLHLHLLPGVDDGPETLDESLALARALVEVGVHRAVVTPHFDAWTAQALRDVRPIARRTAALREHLSEAGIPLPITPGGSASSPPNCSSGRKGVRCPAGAVRRRSGKGACACKRRPQRG